MPECPEASVEPQMETSQNVEPVSEEHEDSHEHGDSEVAVESQQQPLEHQEEKEELENKILDVAAEHHEEQVQGDEDSVESSIPAPSDEPDPVTQAQEKSAHTLISDQVGNISMSRSRENQSIEHKCVFAFCFVFRSCD